MPRILTLLEVPQLVAIEQATQAAPWTEETFNHCLQQHCDLWGECIDQQVIGFIVVSSTIAGESHILNLGVAPAYQRQGIGWRLLLQALKHAKSKGAGTAYLEVRSSNKGAIALYEKMGFVQISQRKNYYPTPIGREDAWVFAKDLGVDRAI